MSGYGTRDWTVALGTGRMNHAGYRSETFYKIVGIWVTDLHCNRSYGGLGCRLPRCWDILGSQEQGKRGGLESRLTARIIA